MSQFALKTLKGMLCAVLACTLFVPTVAFADLQAANPERDTLTSQASQSSSDSLKENSWRYENGQLRPEFSGQEGIDAQSENLSVQAYEPSDPSMTHLGIDVSYAQGHIDWDRVAKTKVKFAIVRCGYGDDLGYQDDTQWKNNVAGCLRNNIPFGVYIYSYAQNTDMARSEARHVLRCLREAGITASSLRFPIYYDVEENFQYNYSNDYLNSLFYAFRDELNRNGISKVGLYSNCEWFSKKWTSVSVPGEYRWVARYGLNDGVARNTYYYGYESLQSKGAGVWQWCSVGRIDGISGHVDMNFAKNDIRYLDQSGSVRNMYRLYNRITGEHLYTADSNECGVLEGRDWVYEGIAWKAPFDSGESVYRLYNPISGDHHYTKDANEYNVLAQSHGWRQEGVAWHTASTDQVPTYRLYHPKALIGSHHFTTDLNEYEVLSSQHGWIKEGVAWYGLKE